MSCHQCGGTGISWASPDTPNPCPSCAEAQPAETQAKCPDCGGNKTERLKVLRNCYGYEDCSDAWHACPVCGCFNGNHVTNCVNETAPRPRPAPVDTQSGGWDGKFHAFLMLNRLLAKFLPPGHQHTAEQADAIHACARRLAVDLTSGRFVAPEERR